MKRIGSWLAAADMLDTPNVVPNWLSSAETVHSQPLSSFDGGAVILEVGKHQGEYGGSVVTNHSETQPPCVTLFQATERATVLCSAWLALMSFR